MTSHDAEPGQFTSLYFGYAANLSPRTMRQRSPDALYVGLARLDEWKWIISSTGYANIVPSPGDVVYGSLYFLTGPGETALDASEGVPWEYQKHKLPVTRVGGESEGQTVQATAYVDSERTEEGPIEGDYVIWVNKAIDDGLKCGIPQEYVDKYMKPATPANNPWIQDIQMIRLNAQEETLSPDVQRK